MDHIRRGNKELIKELNRMLVLDQIRVNGPMSRTDIARNTELGLSTITNITEELLQEGLVVETGEGSSSGGRKPVLLKFNGEFGLVAGVKIEQEQLIFCCSNLEAHIIKKKHCSYSRTASTEEINALIIAEIEELVTNSIAPGQNFSGIGIGVSGLVDSERRRVIYSPILSWEYHDFQAVADHFDVPVFIDNDANVFALAHLWIGSGRGYRNFIGVTVGAGVGAGIVIDRQLYSGEFGGAGELGHVVIQNEGSPCYCGQRGCLEMYASDRFLLSEAQRVITLGLPTVIAKQTPVTVSSLCDAAVQGDIWAQDILTKQGRNLGIGIKNMVNLFNPAAIILGGEGLRGDQWLVAGLQAELQSNFFAKHEKKLELHLCDLGEDVWLIGACLLVVQDLFKAPLFRQETT